MKKSILHELVRKEVEVIESMAIPEELDRLNYDDFACWHNEKCIYGLMTGNAFSARTSEFRDKVNTPKDFLTSEELTQFDVDTGYSFCNILGLTAMEVYVMLKKANNISLINYLKGESTTLVL